MNTIPHISGSWGRSRNEFPKQSSRLSKPDRLPIIQFPSLSPNPANRARKRQTNWDESCSLGLRMSTRGDAGPGRASSRCADLSSAQRRPLIRVATSRARGEKFFNLLSCRFTGTP
ncbi:hypothetical protein Nepgr_023544 [Nepenthes gracilis]|uniref:Uncharacterized protein n=1 Tax=Nepenthes gracilis TaxID=150966 RepID=A0AAD3XXT5_NEPGR|nr:hypothetical protein Nepgr_023544 [Nepenthes gracilis]